MTRFGFLGFRKCGKEKRITVSFLYPRSSSGNFIDVDISVSVGWAEGRSLAASGVGCGRRKAWGSSFLFSKVQSSHHVISMVGETVA